MVTMSLVEFFRVLALARTIITPTSVPGVLFRSWVHVRGRLSSVPAGGGAARGQSHDGIAAPYAARWLALGVKRVISTYGACTGAPTVASKKINEKHLLRDLLSFLGSRCTFKSCVDIIATPLTIP